MILTIKDCQVGDEVQVYVDIYNDISFYPTTKTIKATIVRMPGTFFTFLLGWKQGESHPNNAEPSSWFEDSSNIIALKNYAFGYCASLELPLSYRTTTLICQSNPNDMLGLPIITDDITTVSTATQQKINSTSPTEIVAKEFDFDQYNYTLPNGKRLPRS